MSKNELEKEIKRLKNQLSELTRHESTALNRNRVQVDHPGGVDVLQNINDVVFSLNEEGRVTFVSASVFKCFGYRPEEVEGSLFTEFLPEDEVERVSVLLDDAIKEGWQELLLEFQFITKSGEVVWIEQNTTLLYQESGDFIATAVARDITEVKRAKDDLLQSESKYQRIIENMELGLMEVDLEGRITMVYEKFAN